MGPFGKGRAVSFRKGQFAWHCGQEIQKIEEGYRNLPGDLERDRGLAVETQRSTPKMTVTVGFLGEEGTGNIQDSDSVVFFHFSEIRQPYSQNVFSSKRQSHNTNSTAGLAAHFKEIGGNENIRRVARSARPLLHAYHCGAP